MRAKISPLQKALNVWAIVIAIWALYRINFKTELPIWFDEFIAKPLVFILPVYYYIVRIEKKPFFQNLDWKAKMPSLDVLIGLGVGIFFFLAGFMGYYMKFKSFPLHTLANVSFAGIVVTALATSISEEVVSRGFILKRLFEESKNIYLASLYASILFFFMHVPILATNQKMTGMILMQFVFTDFLLSFTVSLIYLQRRNLWLPILIHALYNISIYLFQS